MLPLSKRPWSIFLICFFTLSILDVPTELFHGGHSGVKRCCCSTAQACHCAHGKKVCPLKPAFKPINEKDGSLVLKAMGCGFRDDHEVSPTYSRDFYSEIATRYFYAPSSGSFLKLTNDNISTLFDHRLDKPPKATLLLSF